MKKLSIPSISKKWLIALLLSTPLCLFLSGPMTALADGEGSDELTEKHNKGQGKSDKSEDDEEDEGEEKDREDNKPYCQKSAQNLFKACIHTALAARWTIAADCENILETTAREACFNDAKQVASEGKKACRIDRDARKSTCDTIGRSAYTGWDDVVFLSGEEGESIEGNDYFPLTTTTPEFSTYVSETSTITAEVTATLREIDGVMCKLVVEREQLTGSEPPQQIEYRERLYAQDIDGTIWNCGVLRQQFSAPMEGQDQIVVSTNGSWEVGKDGSQAGIVMTAAPVFGEVARRSYAPGIEEELTEVVDPLSVESELTCESDCIILRVTSPLMPEGHSDEYYQLGTGLISSENEDGGDRVELQP